MKKLLTLVMTAAMAVPAGAVPNVFSGSVFGPGASRRWVAEQSADEDFAVPAVPAPRAGPSVPPALTLSHDGYFLEEFRRMERDFLFWDDRWQAAPSGSASERLADSRRRTIFDAVLRLVSGGGLESESPATLERFGDEAYDKYNAARSGSLKEQLYQRALAGVWPAFEVSVRREFEHERDWTEMIEAAERYYEKYNAARSGSSKERAYLNVSRAAWEVAERALDSDLNSGRYRYEDIETTAGRFDDGYQAARSGSRKEQFYDRARRTAYDAAVRAFEREIDRRHGDGYLTRLYDEYTAKERAARSGSVKENYYRRVLRIIENHLGSHPYPAPQARRPYPGLRR